MIAEVIAPSSPEDGDIQPIMVSHIGLHSGPTRRALVIVIVIGSVPWNIAPSVPAVPEAAGVEPPLAAPPRAGAAGLAASDLDRLGVVVEQHELGWHQHLEDLQSVSHRGTLRARSRASPMATPLPVAESCGPFQDCGIAFLSVHLATG